MLPIYHSCINQQMHTYKVVQLYVFYSQQLLVSVTPVTIFSVFHDVNISSTTEIT